MTELKRLCIACAKELPPETKYCPSCDHYNHVSIIDRFHPGYWATGCGVNILIAFGFCSAVAGLPSFVHIPDAAPILFLFVPIIIAVIMGVYSLISYWRRDRDPSEAKHKCAACRADVLPGAMACSACGHYQGYVPGLGCWAIFLGFGIIGLIARYGPETKDNDAVIGISLLVGGIAGLVVIGSLMSRNRWKKRGASTTQRESK